MEIMEMRCVHIVLMNTKSWKVHGSWLQVALPMPELPSPLPPFPSPLSPLMLQDPTTASEVLDNGSTLTYYVNSTSSTTSGPGAARNNDVVNPTINVLSTTSSASAANHDDEKDADSEWEVVN